MSCLLINDIDAGLGHFANTQVCNSINPKHWFEHRQPGRLLQADSLVAGKDRVQVAATQVDSLKQPDKLPLLEPPHCTASAVLCTPRAVTCICCLSMPLIAALKCISVFAETLQISTLLCEYVQVIALRSLHQRPGLMVS